MKRLFFFCLVVMSAFAVSCAKQEMEDDGNVAPGAGASGWVTVCATMENKAEFGDSGFGWNEGDKVKWISSGVATVSTLAASDIVSGNTARFRASIPGLASGDVQGWFAVNSETDGTVNFAAGEVSGEDLTVIQKVAGEINPANLFLLSTTGMNTIRKGSSGIELSFGFAGSVISVCPFTSKYSSEKVESVRILSDSYLAGSVRYDHSSAGAGSLGGQMVKAYKVSLETAFPLSGASAPDKSAGIYFSLPAITLESYRIVVTTNLAKYFFDSESPKILKENHLVRMPLDLDKAVRKVRTAPAALALSESMVSTNAPMEYVSQGKDNNDAYGFGNPDWFNSIAAGQESARRARFDVKSNMWDGNASTSYHTNLDWGKVGTSWGTRFSKPFVSDYIQINLGRTYPSLELSLTADGYAGYLASGWKISVNSDGGTSFGTPVQVSFGADRKATVSLSDVRVIRFLSGRECDWTGVESSLGISEIKITPAADNDDSEDRSDPEQQDSEVPGDRIRTIDNPRTTYYIPRRWKSGMNVSSNSWYKYWSDPTATWNSSNTNLWLPNCTHYCMGRTAEISGKPIFSNHELFKSGYANAQNWYANAKWSKGSTPKLGAICVWGGGEYGHVAIVEGINDDGTVNISQSSYQSTNRTFDNPKYFNYWENISCVVGKVSSRIGWTFIGYIYNPYVYDIRTTRNTACSQVDVFVTALVVRNDSMVANGLSVLPGIYNVYDKREFEGRTWVKIADNAWIPLQSDWNTMYY